ncbi:protein spinster homolog 1 [Ammospiza caudacuta]|uniref:protein spinster homolog 1 n=1 Tax=Ammospiza caudacuta TaxID=2857398 RepID=UPI0027390FBF|nr:protein spinster homolog 1 [Ammospiza caudacuta]
MDRFTVAGVLPEVEDYFGIGDSSSGLLQTVFISSYLVLAPLFGFLGDRHSRKRLLALGLALWSGVTLATSFVPPQHFGALLAGRALVGVGEAAYSTLAPTLVADLFRGPARSRALGGFYLAVPLGSGLGYIAGSKVKDLAADWRWALRVTPVLGLVALLLLLALVSDPPRGGLDGAPATLSTSWGHDLRELGRNRTLVLSTLGFTSVAFVTGALALWAPAFLFRTRLARGEGQPCRGRRCQGDQSLLFGALTCGSGVLGVGLGAELSRRLRPREPRADPLLCAGGLLGGAPCLLLALVCAKPCPPAAYVFIFLGETLLSLNWAIVADILLYVVPPGRRSTAEALQIVASHLLGDAGSPYLVGLVSDALGGGAAAISYQRGAGALLRALLLLPFAAALGGAAFLAAGNSLPRDRRRARREARGLPPDGDDDDDDDDDDGDHRGDHRSDRHGDPAAIVVPPAAGGRTRRVPVAHVLA